MTVIKETSILSEIVAKEPSLITILNRFNVFLGFGDKTVEKICEEKSLDLNFFLTVMNTYINEDFIPEGNLNSYDSIVKIIEYFGKTNNYYLRFQIPNIERHFDLLISQSAGGNNNLGLLRDFFSEVKKRLLCRISNDNEVLFPKVMNRDYTDWNKCEDDNIEDMLNDLINLFVKHLRGDYDVNLCHAVLIAVLSLQKDIRQNNRIRYRILFPFIERNIL